MIDFMQRKVAIVETEPEAEEPAQAQEKKSQIALDPRVLSSVLVSVKLAQFQDEGGNHSKDSHARLLELMHSSPMRALLDAAVLFAERQGLEPHEALQQMVMNLQEIDKLWNQVLLKEGLAHLSSQYH